MQKTIVHGVKSPKIQYVLLSIICAATILYHARLAEDLLHDLSQQRVVIPQFDVTSARAKLTAVSPEAVAAGLHDGDVLLEVNGRPYTGTAVLAEELAKLKPGTGLTVKVRSTAARAAEERMIVLSGTAVNSSTRSAWFDLFARVARFAMPLFCTLLGIWVVIARPRDLLAWLLLGVMLSFAQEFESPRIASWGPVVRELGMTYHRLLATSWPIFMYFFGLYFPEPFPASFRKSGFLRNLWWKALFWIGVIPQAIAGVTDTVTSVGELYNYRAVAPLYSAVWRFEFYAGLMSFLLVSVFFAAISIKIKLAISTDAKRRLRLLYFGTTLAMTPFLVVTIIQGMHRTDPARPVPDWIVAFAIAMLALFPLTLAYVIVVQRAMDVRMVLRQGMQYALAKTGLRALQMIASTAMIAFVIYEVGKSGPQHRLTAVAIGIAGFFAIRRVRSAGEKARSWLDRRFFRESYNIEQVLTELSDQVRSMMETRPLLETVVNRIAETLHVRNIAVLLSGSEIYQPAYALGFSGTPHIEFPSSTATVKHLRKDGEPARVYLEDSNSWIYSEPEATEEERTKLSDLGAELLLPLVVRDKLLGFISLGPKRSEEPYSGSDVRLLKSVAAQTGLALENANLMRTIADEVAQRERLNREVEIAREVQERLFPQKLPEIGGLDYCGHCRPALGVGGDYYDFLALPAGHLGIAIGDVSGKGIAAALMMASLQASLRGEATRAPENLAVVVANINRLVYEASAAHRYATFFYGQYNPATREFQYVNAGHNPPMLFHSCDGKCQVSRLEVGGTVVGLLESFPYQQGKVTLAPCDILVAFTDGISEAMNQADEEWGEKNLVETIENNSKLPPAELLQQILKAADAFAGGAKQHDDMTLVVLRVLQDGQGHAAQTSSGRSQRAP
jgi:sigma-B regulation protein RsbU (phosphoserine phosphatase)